MRVQLRYSVDLHEVASRGLLLPLSRARRLARPSQRPALRAFRQSLRFRTAAKAWSDDRKREWILHRLRETVRYAARESEHYRTLFARIGFDPAADFSFDEFGALPVLDRADVNAAGRAMIATTLPGWQLRHDATGGSTGAPTEVWLGPEERGWRESATAHFMTRAGVPAGASVACIWGHHLDPKASDGWRARLYAFQENVRWFDCFRLSTAVLDRYHEQLTRRPPTAILAYASALGSFAERLLERGVTPVYPRRALITGAEKLMPAHREAIERAFGMPVHERYGSRDIGAMAFQSHPERSRDFEVDWSNVLIEPETRDGRSPESAILVTKLHGDGMPMLRYRVGDVASFPNGSRPGSPALALHEIVGRHSDRIWLPDGRWLHGIQASHMLKDYPVKEFMFVQREDYSIELQIVPKPGFDDAARRHILELMDANLDGVAMNLVTVDTIHRTRANKWRPVISRVRVGSGP